MIACFVRPARPFELSGALRGFLTLKIKLFDLYASGKRSIPLSLPYNSRLCAAQMQNSSVRAANPAAAGFGLAKRRDNRH
jgi:hypothetical protein